mmetsp:Transcript_12876/g.22086  ORF Transcript_12876/g.22086 Transcript_12876/m.22086 type:complete len:401 (+) Transcript_12876:665-1867(+)
MGRTILTQEDRIVRGNVDGVHFRQGGHTDRRALVVGEDEESGVVWNQTTVVERKTVADGTHSVLTDTESEVSALWGSLLEIAVALQDGQVGGGQIGGTTNKAWHNRGNGVQHDLGDLSGGLGSGLSGGLSERGLITFRNLVLDALDLEESSLLGVLGLVSLEALLPLGLKLGTLSDLAERVVGDFLGNLEWSVLPVQALAGGGHFGGTEGSTVDGVRVCLVWRSVTDNGGDDDQSGSALVGLGLRDRLLDGCDIGVTLLNAEHLPSVGFVSLADVLGERNAGSSVDGDTVIVVKGDELAKSPMASERACLSRNTLHHASITENAVGVVIDDLSVRLVEDGGKMGLCGGQADGVTNPLAQRSRGDLNTCGHKVLRMSWADGVCLSEGLDIVDGNRVVSEQV